MSHSYAIVKDESGEWIAIYIDGDKVAEGNYIPVEAVFALLKLEAERIVINSENYGWGFPEKLSDIKEIDRGN